MSVDRQLTERLAYAAYDVVGGLAALICAPALPFVLGGRGSAAAERLGFVPAPRRPLGQPVWIHAASVGEVLAAVPLVEAVRSRRPELSIVMSTMTATGREVALREASPDVLTFLPLDVVGVVDRAVRRLHPRCLVLVETEIWPGLLRAVGNVGAPAVMVSGRLSARTLGRYRWLEPLFRGAIRGIAAFGMQTPDDATRIMSLGAAPACVRVTGSLKASRVPRLGSAPLGGIAERPFLVAASTQADEEAFVLDSVAALWSRYPDLLLLLAPRRPERFETVRRLLAERGLGYERRSAMSETVSAATRVFLLDSVGELARFFPLARAVFVGGTVAPLGGHNVLEPATFGKAVAFGPHTGNVAAQASCLLASTGAVEVREPADLTRFWERVLADPQAAEALGQRARAAAGDAGALERTWEMLAPHLGTPCAA